VSLNDDVLAYRQDRDQAAENPGMAERIGEGPGSCKSFLACAITLACHPQTALTGDEHQPLEFALNLSPSQIEFAAQISKTNCLRTSIDIERSHFSY
jgi:hypothetical protein